jgi:hypothetical protein
MALGPLTANLMGIGGLRAHTKGYADIRHSSPTSASASPEAGAVFYAPMRGSPRSGG